MMIFTYLDKTSTRDVLSIGGLPQSLSGSETDVSTSNENLSNEERYVIRHMARQEPQGQENQQQSPSRSSSHKENIPNIQVHPKHMKNNRL